MSSAGRAGGYFSDGLLNLFYFDKDLTTRRKNPARGLGGEKQNGESVTFATSINTCNKSDTLLKICKNFIINIEFFKGFVYWAKS